MFRKLILLISFPLSVSALTPDRFRHHESLLGTNAAWFREAESSSIGGVILNATRISGFNRLVFDDRTNRFVQKAILLSGTLGVLVTLRTTFYLSSGITISLYNRNRRTGPFSGHLLNLLNTGIRFINEPVFGGSQLGGITLNGKIYPQNLLKGIGRFHLYYGVSWLHQWNKNNETPSGFLLELGLGFRLNKLRVSVY